MEATNEISGLLDLMVQPAFSVRNGQICDINAAAQGRLITRDMQLEDLLITGQQEYADFRDGCLYLTLRIHNTSCGASVSRVGDSDIFVLEQDADQMQLQAMALAAKELRLPLNNAMTITDGLFPVSGKDGDPDLLEQVAKINRGLFQMHRIICNMSDAYRYSQETDAVTETRDICSLMTELFESNKELVKHAGIDLHFIAPSEPIYCLVDWEKLERGIHNILSNAVKFSPAGTCIQAKLTRSGQLLYLTVQDGGSGVAPALRSGIHARYLREPGIEDGRYGIGLGMVLIRSAAAAHGGTVLMEYPQEQGARVTMTIAIRNDTSGTVRSPQHRFAIDYTGGWDHRLLELSEALPASAYRKELN